MTEFVFEPIQTDSDIQQMSSSSKNEFSESILKCVNQILMDEKPITSFNPLDLQATEKSFYDILGQNYPPCIDQDSEHNLAVPKNMSRACLFGSDSLLGSHIPTNDPVLLFSRGLEEASKFLPGGNQLVIDLKGKMVKEAVLKSEKDGNIGSDARRRKKNHKRIDIFEEESRSNKQSAIVLEGFELSDMLDKVLLSAEVEDTEKLSKITEEKRNGVKNKASTTKNGKKEVVDLRNLLYLCAEAVSSYDHKTANELLKQIRQHSSPSGDGSQRLAHFFANALEARLAGTIIKPQSVFSSLASKRNSTIDKLREYQFHLSAFPFKKFSIIFANKMILGTAENAKSLHIVDFGIVYGFQWPVLIQQLSKRPGGPPKLRITGIDLPQPGLRPAERIEATGVQLADYCNRFNVPFEYIAIVSEKWETIQIEELKMDKDEVIAVNCMFQFKNLLDETVLGVNNPRNAVLHLIGKMNPNIFVHSIINGSYDSPFFTTRFRETVFHFSAFFDMYDTLFCRENEERMMFEREVLGRVVMNTIACEGLDRIERPETYKQWQIRMTKAGFKQVPIEEEVMNKLRGMLKGFYHKDFAIDEDSDWMLHLWKGRTTHASSCWVPL